MTSVSVVPNPSAWSSAFSAAPVPAAAASSNFSSSLLLIVTTQTEVMLVNAAGKVQRSWKVSYKSNDRWHNRDAALDPFTGALLVFSHPSSDGALLLEADVGGLVNGSFFVASSAAPSHALGRFPVPRAAQAQLLVLVVAAPPRRRRSRRKRLSNNFLSFLR